MLNFIKYLTFNSTCRFSGGFGARDYRQTAAGGTPGGFGGRGGRNQAGHGGTRGFGGGEYLVCVQIKNDVVGGAGFITYSLMLII